MVITKQKKLKTQKEALYFLMKVMTIVDKSDRIPNYFLSQEQRFLLEMEAGMGIPLNGNLI